MRQRRLPRDSSEIGQTLADLAPDAIIAHESGRIIYANAAAAALVGAATPLEGEPIEQFLHPPFLKAEGERILRGEYPEGGPPLTEEMLRRLDGTEVPVEVLSRAWLSDDHLRVLAFVRDVSDRVLAREQLAVRDSQLRLVHEHLPAVSWATDTGLRLLWFRARQGTPDAPEGSPVVDAFVATPEGVAERLHRQALAGESVSGAMVWHGRHYDLRIEPMRDGHERIVGTVGLALDSTERREAEAHRYEDLRLEGLARIAAGVAHGINNALAVVSGVASGLASTPLAAPAPDDLDVILDACRRARDLTTRLLGFASEGPFRSEAVDLVPLLRKLAPSAGGRLRVIVPDDLPRVLGDPDQLRQAFGNLYENAMEATAGGGHVRVSASVSERVEVCIADTGPGMAADLLAHAIEPFFTTKEHGEGLGLSMAYGVFRRSGGDLVIESEPAGGTRVYVFMPIAPTPAVGLPAPAGTRSGRVVLVVDDDEWVRFSTARLLRPLGFEPIEAPDGATGLMLYAEHRERVAFVLLDLRMPGMDGEHVLNELHAADPDVRVILATGFERGQVAQRLFAFPNVGFLCKPYTTQELLAQVEAVGAEVP